MSLTHNAFESETKELTPTESERELNETMMTILRKNILNQILKIDSTFLTGSNYWYSDFYITNPHSDYDICVPELYRDQVNEITKKANLTTKPGTYNNGVYVSVGKEKINIIYLGQGELKSWKLTTDIMEFLTKKFESIKKTKKVRIGVFLTLRSLIKMLESVS